MKIINNFLDQESFLKLQYEVLSNRLPWYFQDVKDLEYEDKKNHLDLNQGQFNHIFYDNYRPASEWFPLLQPLLKKLKVKSLIKIKANLIPYSSKFYEGYYHTDTPLSCLSAIYYINNNNGYTRFEKNNKKVESRENRIVMFDSELKHRGTNTTDHKKRVVLNLTYF